MGKGGRSSSSSGSRGIGNRNLCCQHESDVSNHGLITMAPLGNSNLIGTPFRRGIVLPIFHNIHADVYRDTVVIRAPTPAFHAQYPMRAMIPLPTKMHVKMYVTLPTLAEVIFGLNRISCASS